MTEKEAARDGDVGTEPQSEWAKARQAVFDLYGACGLPAPRIHVAHTAGQFHEIRRLADAVSPRSAVAAIIPVICLLVALSAGATLFWFEVLDAKWATICSVFVAAIISFENEGLVVRIRNLVSYRFKTPFKGFLAPCPDLIECLTSSGAVAGQRVFWGNRFTCLDASPEPVAGAVVLRSRMGDLVEALRGHASDALLSGTDVVLLPQEGADNWQMSSSPKLLPSRKSRKLMAAARKGSKGNALTKLEAVGCSMLMQDEADGRVRTGVKWQDRLSEAGVIKLVSRAGDDSLWEFRGKEFRVTWLRWENGDGLPASWIRVGEHLSDATEARDWLVPSLWAETVKIPPEIPSDAEGLLTELYRACGAPPPRIVTVGSRPAFVQLVNRARDPRSGLATLAWPSSMLATSICGMAMLQLPAIVGVTGIVGIAVSETVVAALSAACLWWFCANLRRCLINPFGTPIRGNVLLASSLFSARCVTDILATGSVVAWGIPHVWGDFQGTPEHRSRVGDLYAAARRMFPMAVLGDGAVIVMAESSGVDTDDTDTTAVLQRLVADACRLRPAAAQVELEFLGIAAVMAALGKEPRTRDARGALWLVEVLDGRLTWLQANDPATGRDVWMVVPNHMTTPGEAVAWTYGLAEVDYGPTLEG